MFHIYFIGAIEIKMLIGSYKIRQLFVNAFFVLFALTLSGCAGLHGPVSEPSVAMEKNVDPYEGFNRTIFSFNMKVDRAVLKPLAKSYRFIMPEFARDRIHGVLTNLSSPVIFANDLMQGQMRRSGVTLSRFALNSTIGLLGMFDVADKMGLPAHDEDFGQTMAVWGVEDGPYLVLPFFGPSTPRDMVGKVVDYALDPFNWMAMNSDDDMAEALGYARAGLTVVDKRERFLDVSEELEKTSVDLYSAMRTIYLQNKDDEVRNGVADEENPADYDFEFPDE